MLPQFFLSLRRSAPALDPIAIVVTAILGLLCNAYVFLIVPNERIMGAVQRIFYFHVGAATASYLIIGVLFIAALAYLATRSQFYDVLGAAAAEISFLLCTIVLVSGMIWGHAAWNTWFRWEPRLVTFLLLWLMLLSLNLLRAFGDKQRLAAHAAVVGIVTACTVPLVILSVKILPAAAQLHPQVVENRGLRDPSFVQAMILCIVTISLFSLVILWLRTRIELLERKLSHD